MKQGFEESNQDTGSGEDKSYEEGGEMASRHDQDENEDGSKDEEEDTKQGFQETNQDSGSLEDKQDASISKGETDKKEEVQTLAVKEDEYGNHSSNESLDEFTKVRKESRKTQEEDGMTLEWAEELAEYDEPDVYPSEKDYKWFEELVTDSEDEEGDKVKEEAEAEKDQEAEENAQDVSEEATKEEVGEGGEVNEVIPDEGEEEEFVLHKPEEEEEEEVVEAPKKKYKAILIRRLVERPPKIHYEPDKERVDFSQISAMPTRPFKFLYSFGFDCQRMANIHVLDAETLVFMSGFVLTFYNHLTSKKTYLRTLGGSSFGALAIHPSKKLFAAAEKGEKPLIGIWSWNKLQLFRKLVEGTEKVYASINFSPDGKLLASQGGDPDYLVTVWNWLKETPVLRVKSHAQDVYRVTFSKELAGLLTTSGLCHIKFWKMAHTFTGLKLKGDLGRFGKTELTDIEGFVEMPDGKVVSGSEWGNLLVWENGLVIAELCISNEVSCHKGNVRYISIVEGDFYTTGEDGIVKVWSFEAVDTAEIYTTEESLKVPLKILAKVVVHEDSDIWSIVPDISNQDSYSVFWFAQDGRGIIWKVDLSFLNTAREPQIVFMAHGGPVVACATSPITYLMTTLGADGRINVYDYVRKRIVATRAFNAAGSCLLWPSRGTDEHCSTLLCGFEDGVLRVLKLSQWTNNQIQSITDRLSFHLILDKAWKPHRRRVSSMVMDSVGELLITGSEDGTIFFFNVKDDFNPLLYVALPGYEPISRLLWSKAIDKEETEEKRKIIAICEGGVIQHLSVSKIANFDNAVSYFSTESKVLSYITVKSVKSVLRHNEELERIRIAEEEKEANLEAELRRLVEQKIETKSQQDIRLLMEAEELEKEIASQPKRKEKKWEPYIPPTPSPILEVFHDPLDLDILNVTMGEYDTGYVYSISLTPLKDTSLNELETDNEPVDAHVIEDCDDVAVTRVVFTAEGDRAVLGFKDGRLRVVDLGVPFDVKDMKCHWTEGIHDLVRGEITSIAFDFDELFLFTTGNDGNCFMFTTDSEDGAAFYCASVPMVIVPLFEEHDAVDIVDSNDYSLEDTKNLAKEMAILAAAKRNKAAKKEDIALLRIRFADIVRRNNEIPEEVRLTPVEFTMATDNVARHEEAMKESLEQLHKEMAWESEKATIALKKLKTYYKDPIECEQFVLKSFDSELKITSFRLTHLPEFYYDAIRTYHTQSALRPSQADTLHDFPSEMDIVKREDEPRPRRKRGMDKFVYQRMVRLWQRRQKKVLRQKEWDDFLTTDPEGKELEDDMYMIQEAREKMGDLKLKTSANYKVPGQLKLTVNRARKRLIDLEEKIYILKKSFNEEMLQLRDYKIQHIVRMQEFRSIIISAQKTLPKEMHRLVPSISDMEPEENPFSLTSYTRQEILSYKLRQQVKADTSNVDKSPKTKKIEPVKRRPGRPVPVLQQHTDKSAVVPEKNIDIGSFVQVVNFPPSALQIQITQIKLKEANFHQSYNLERIDKEKFRFDTLLKLLRHRKVKLDCYIKAAESTMVLLTEEFLQAQKCQSVESKLERIISNAIKEHKVCTMSLKTTNKQIDNRRKEVEEISLKRNVLLKEVQEMAAKVPQYERYLIRVFKKKIDRSKRISKKGEDDNDDDSSESDESDESDDLNMDEDDETDDDLDVDLPPQDLNMEIYEAVIDIRGRRLGVDDLEAAVKASTDELVNQANGFKSRMSTAEKILTDTRAGLDAFIYDKQNKLNSIDFAVNVRLHQMFYMAPNLDQALITTKSTIKGLKDRIPELKKEKKQQKKQKAETKKMFSHLQHTRQAFLERLDEMRQNCDHEMLLKFGHIKTVEELEYFELCPEVLKLRRELEEMKTVAWAEERQLKEAYKNVSCIRGHITESTATNLIVRAELIEELSRMNNSMENTFHFLTIKASSSNYKEDLKYFKMLVWHQWQMLRDLQVEIATLTWRPRAAPVPPIKKTTK